MFFLFFLFVVSVIFSVLIFGKLFRNYSVEYVNFNNDMGDRVNGILYYPSVKGVKTPGRFPALISIHYGLQNREALQPAAKMAAENNYLVMDLILKKSRNTDNRTKDFQDYLSDARGAVEYLKNHPNVDDGKIFISGHSIGGNITALTGEGNKNATGVIAVGYPITFSPNSPQPLMIASGVFDELHPYPKISAAFKETTGEGTSSGQIIEAVNIKSSVRDGKIPRILQISFLSDHYVEPTDPVITEGILEFAASVNGDDITGRNPGRSKFLFILGILSRIFLFITSFLVCAAGFVEIDKKAASVTNIPDIIKSRIPVIITIVLILLIGFLHKPAEHNIHITFLSALLISLISFHHFRNKVKERELSTESGDSLIKTFLGDMLKILKYLAIFWLSYLGGLFFNAGFFPLSKFSHIWRTLTGVLYLPAAQFFVFCTRVNNFFLKEDWSFNFLSPLLWIIILAEIIYPGAAGVVVDNFFSRLIGALQKMEFKLKFKMNLPGVILLIVVIIANIIFWRQILAEGYSLGFAEILGLMKLLFSFIILPAAILTMLLRKIKISNSYEHSKQ